MSRNVQLEVVGRAGPARRSVVSGDWDHTRAIYHSGIGCKHLAPERISESARWATAPYRTNPVSN